MYSYIASLLQETRRDFELRTRLLLCTKCQSLVLFPMAHNPRVSKGPLGN